MCAIPFGFAVVPDVYMRKRRSSASIGSGGQRGRVVGDLELVQPDVAALVASAPRCRCGARRGSASSPGASAIASSAVRLSGTVEPRRHASSCVTAPRSPCRSCGRRASRPRSRRRRPCAARRGACTRASRPAARGPSPCRCATVVPLADAELLERVREADDLALELGVGDARAARPPARPPSGRRRGRRGRPRRAGRRSCRRR